MSLERFVAAQARVWPAPLAEIRAGRKESHWMWFVFPQLRGLGRSATARHYGIADMGEARAYLAHEVLGPRLVGISRAMLAHEGASPEAILGPVDAMKLRSCATLFRAADPAEPVFDRLLRAFHDDAPCELTQQWLRDAAHAPPATGDDDA
jgi:uncharacterized protein (DUF1810 family)